MPEAMDGKTEAAFEELQLLSAETRERFAEQRKATAAMVARLEEKYAERGLKFTQPFYGVGPVQAFGHLDGLRFYFRFRQNWGALRLGPYDAEIEELRYLRYTQQDTRSWAKAEAEFAAGEIDEEVYAFQRGYSFAEDGVKQESEPDFLPTRILKAAGANGSDDEEDGYNGFLTDEEAFQLFSHLVDNLESVPAEKQLNEHERIWLYEGLDAADAWWEKQLAPKA